MHGFFSTIRLLHLTLKNVENIETRNPVFCKKVAPDGPRKWTPHPPTGIGVFCFVFPILLTFGDYFEKMVSFAVAHHIFE